MHYQQTIRVAKFSAIILLAALAVLAHLHGGTIAAQDRPGRLFEIVGMNVPFEQRVGVDDAATFVIHFSGDTRGGLDTCG